MTNARPPHREGSRSDDEPVDLAMTRVQPPRSAPRLAAAMWLVAGFVFVAVLKPWGGGGPVAATLRPDIAVIAEPTPLATEDRSATGLAVPVCLGAGAWRVATLETWRGHDVRVWRAISPVAEAGGPLDPAIPTVPVVADVLSALGWCAPAFGADQPVGPARVQAWHVVDGAARQVFLRQVQPVDGVTPIAALYLPVSGSWLAGRIVFQYRDANLGTIRWFGADLEILLPQPGGSPAAPTPGSASTEAPTPAP